ncbi:hypothetical protein [Gimesia sp.]|uniref:hypothetical protein n=1 Tax=Gimesia sp. TaxID=2024833 RepID=UPI003A93E166
MRIAITFFLLFSGIVGLALAQQDDTLSVDAADKPANLPDTQIESKADGANSRKENQLGESNNSKVKNATRFQPIQALRMDYERAERDSARYATELKNSALPGRKAKKKGTGLLNDSQKSDQAARNKAENKLNDAVQRAFNLRHQLQMAQIELVEQNLRETRAQLSQRKQDAKTIIRRRIEELTSSDDLSWLGNSDNKSTASLVPHSHSKLLQSPGVARQTQSSSDVFVYPRDAVKNYIESAIALDAGKASHGATSNLAQKEILKHWGELFMEHPPQIQMVLLDSDALHSHVMATADGERLMFELKRSTGGWRLAAISQLEK